MAREWTERHIRELIARSGGGGGSGQIPQGYFSATIPSIGIFGYGGIATQEWNWNYLPLPLTDNSEAQNYDYVSKFIAPDDMTFHTHPHGIWVGRIEAGNSLIPAAWNYYGGAIPSDLDSDGNIIPSGRPVIANIVSIVPVQYVPLRTPRGKNMEAHCWVFPGCISGIGAIADSMPPLTYTAHRLTRLLSIDSYAWMENISDAEACLEDLQAMTVPGGDIEITIHTARAYPEDSQGVPYVLSQGRRGTASATVVDTFSPIALHDVNTSAVNGYLYTRTTNALDASKRIAVASGPMALISTPATPTAGYYWCEVNHFTTATNDISGFTM